MSERGSFVITIEVDRGLMRLDQALLEKLRAVSPGISRNQLKSLFEEKKVKLGGVARPASWSLLPGSYEVTLEGIEGGVGPQLAHPSTRGSFLPVVYEDSELLVLNKLSGIPSVPHSSQETETAVGSALAHFPALVGVGRGGLEPGLLHRLDTGTSGLLAFAKTNEAFQRIHEAWKQGRVKKIYRAWVKGDVLNLKLPMNLQLTLAHHPESQKRMIVLPEGVKRKYRGKPLATSTTLLSCVRQTELNGATFSDLEVEIKTGVMHQIRCTLAHLDIPIAGDPIYNSEDKSTHRLLLHAWKLIFPTGLLAAHKTTLFEMNAPLPDDFTL